MPSRARPRLIAGMGGGGPSRKIKKQAAWTETSLSSVSCSSARACFAVGYYEVGGEPCWYDDFSGCRQDALVELWDGRRWSIQPAPRVTASREVRLDYVSCTSGRTCTAIGIFVDSRGQSRLFAAHWNGCRWAIEPLPKPRGAKKATVSGLSCPARTACTAVGAYTGTSGRELIYAERWNGSQWIIQTIATPSGADSVDLAGVPCTSSTACIAVGGHTTKAGIIVTLAERLYRSAWHKQRTVDPMIQAAAGLNAVSCPSSLACTAVGAFDGSSGTATLAERWDGTSWKTQETPNPSDREAAILNGVSCSSSVACRAVGYSASGGRRWVLAEAWNGAQWTITKAANPNGADDSLLNAVACTSATACIAAGSSFGSYRKTLAERWDGSRWTIQDTANPPGATENTLNGVSCTSATDCTAVGSFSDATGTVALVERWDGNRWSLQNTPAAADYANIVLNGVSCTSTTACTAVGTFNYEALVERWDGTHWTVQTTPTPAADASSTLSGVSCTSATACTAVGSFSDGAGNVTVVERWDGTDWTVDAIPNPAGLSGVSCTSESRCTAVGGQYGKELLVVAQYP